ncbi:MAG: DUF2478 domain-containing protein [Castellaniella sp.]|uniref:DUF2478 domain-containing protein n=1 Tax=Castellaniella sp. TaxID=1955812 RepID=UPI002A3667F5|nr:DUF2478 domain-containing protein [Castellaniella sp.]MDY0309636.1 DUF2478 domain-containing protein [Castellaniella sp.]
MDAPLPPIAAIVHAHEDAADAVMLDFVNDLRARGRSVHGLLMARRPDGRRRGGRCLRDIDTGDIFEIFQDLGEGSQACCLDISCLAAAASTLRTAVQARPDLVVVNRFGRQEADGAGFAQEFLTLMSEDIPVLTIVAEEFLGDWRQFTGGLGVELSADMNHLRAWETQALNASRRAAHAG